jgi:hypothetical protein
MQDMLPLLLLPLPLLLLLVCLQTSNAVDFVKLLLDMREKYETTIVHAFADDKNFKNALNSVRAAFLLYTCRDVLCSVYSMNFGHRQTSTLHVYLQALPPHPAEV